MQHDDGQLQLLTRIRFYFWLLVSAWTLCIACSLLWNLRQQSLHSREVARHTAKVTFENEVLYRRWAAERGGVYARVSEDCPPNPYLRVADRDVTTTTGLKLTLINPAYMARQVNALADASSGARGHLTSLRPIRPENAPDPWEADALELCEQGMPEVSELLDMSDGEHMRLLRPFVVERSCLKCHGTQGYKVGDVRGGISVTVPMAPIRAIERPLTVRLALAHLGLWCVGLTGAAFFRRNMQREVCAREEAEQSLVLQAEMLQQLFEHVPLMLVMWEPRLRRFTLNRHAEAVLGWTTSDANAMDFLGAVYPDEAYRSEVAAYMQTLQPGWKEWSVTTKEGQRVPSDWANIRLSDDTMVGVGVDLRERKRAEADLRQSERRLRLALEAAYVISFEWDIQRDEVRRLVSCEPALGATPETRPDSFEDVLNVVHPDDRARFAAGVRAAVESDDGAYACEFRVLRPDGQVVWLDERGVVEHDEQGRPVRLIGLSQDITARKQAEQQLRKSLADKEVLLKEVHHRVKNNMQVISSLLALQAGRNAEPALRSALDDLTYRVRSMALVHEMLYESADLAQVEFSQYARSLLSFLWSAHDPASSAVRLTMDLQPVYLDLNRAVPCGLILNELVCNALEHAFRGCAAGEMFVRVRSGPAAALALTVRDNGVGFPSGDHWQDAETLGLRLVRLLAEQLHAQVEFRGDGGTEFSIAVGGTNP